MGHNVQIIASGDQIDDDTPKVTGTTVGAKRAIDVNVVKTVGSGGGSGTEYTEGETDASITGTAALAEGPSDTLTPLQVDASGNLKVSVENATITVDGTVTANHEVTSTATHSNVSGSATSVTLLSSNGSRRGATIYNDSIAVLYVKLGATASTTSFTVKMYEDDFFEVPFGYTGVIDGIWASAAGSARVVEFTS